MARACVLRLALAALAARAGGQSSPTGSSPAAAAAAAAALAGALASLAPVTPAQPSSTGQLIWPQYGGDAAHTGQSPYKSPASAALFWKTPLTGGVMGAALTLDEEGVLYATTRDAALSALDTLNAGSVRWAQKSTAVSDAPIFFTTPALQPQVLLTGRTDGLIMTIGRFPGLSGFLWYQHNAFSGAVRTPPNCAYDSQFAKGPFCWYAAENGAVVAVTPTSSRRTLYTPDCGGTCGTVRAAPTIKYGPGFYGATINLFIVYIGVA